MNEKRHVEIKNTIKAFVRDELHLDRELTEGDLASQLDSMQRLALVVAIEDHFLICFDPDDETETETLEQVVNLIETKLDAKRMDNESPT